MAIRGTLQEMSLGDLLQLLALGRKQGRLLLSGEGADGIIRVRDGAVVDAGVLAAPSRLPRRVAWLGLRPGPVAPPCSLPGLTEGEAASRLLGDEVGTSEAARAIRAEAAACVEEAVHALLAWPAGTFTFDGGAADEPVDAVGAPLVRRPIDALLLEAARRTDEWPRLRRALPALAAALRPVAPACPDGQRGTAVASRLWTELDGRRGVQEVADETGLDPFTVAEQVADWVRTGAVRLDSTGHAPSDRPNPRAAVPGSGGEESDGRAPADRFREAVTRLRRGGWAEAVSLLEPLAGPDAPAAVHHNLALGLEQLGRLAEATAHAALAREKAGGPDPRLTVSEAFLALQQGDAPLADRLLGAAPVPDPCPAAWYHARGVAALLVGDVARACATLEAGVVAYPGDGGLLLNLGSARLAAGETEEAIRLLQRAVRAGPQVAAAHKALGDAWYAAQRWDEALEAYRSAVALAPAHGPDVHGRMGDIHFRHGDVVEARAAWARALAIDPTHRLARVVATHEVAA
ncbi:MAG: tetratricopeptide repeat protein [Gemmatimonadetes bacterium]|nr:tetratricopeptide repeat protein [Gemmatimonadota bacterium]